MKRIPVCMLVIINLLITIESIGQTTVYIPDPNFRQYLLITYPDFMDTNQYLRTSFAATFQGNLSLDSLNISNAEGIQYFTASPSIDLSHNNISMLPDLSGLTKVSLIKLNHNKLTSFPQLPKDHSISGFYIQNNHLSFEDLLKCATYTNIVNRMLSPQELIKIPAELSILGRTSLMVDLGIDKNENNTYSWSKDGVNDYIVTDRNILVLSNLSISDTGTYKCTIKNNDPEWSLLGKPLLYTTKLKLTADSCFTFNGIKYTTSPAECLNGGELVIDLNTVNAPVTSSAYELSIQQAGTSASFVSVNGLFENLKASDYTLTYSDTTGCRVKWANGIKISSNLSECPEVIITPDGDNNQDDYFIEDAGNIKVYNRSGLLIRELYGPATWDGSDAQGRYSMGVYIIRTPKRTFSVYVYL